MRFTFFMLLTFSGMCFSQMPFASAFGGSGVDYAESIILTHDNGFAILGYTESFDSYDGDICLIKTDSNGRIEWGWVIGGVSIDYGYSLIQISDTEYIISGATFSFGAGQYDVLVLKLSSDGIIEWNNVLGGTGSDFGSSIIQRADDGFIIVGTTYSLPGGCSLFALKLNAFGEIEWTKFIGGTEEEGFSTVIGASDGGFLAVGQTISYGAGRGDMLISKFDALGEIEWMRTAGGDTTEGAYSVAPSSNGGYTIVGETHSYGLYAPDSTSMLFVKCDSVGDLEYASVISATGAIRVYSIISTNDGGYAITGRVYNRITETGGDMILIKLDSSYSLEFAKAIGGINYDRGFSIIQLPEGGYAIMGETRSYGAGYIDMFLVKVDSFGDGCIVRDAFLTEIDITSSIEYSTPALSVIPGVFISTSVLPDIRSFSPVVTQICAGWHILEENIRPNRFSLSAHPNPFNSAVKIMIETPSLSPPQTGEMPQAEGVLVEIFDLSGRRVAELPDGGTVGEGLRPSRVSQTIETGGSETAPLRNNEYIWQPAASLPSGVYLVRARFDTRSLSGAEAAATAAVTKRVVLLK